MGRRHDPRKHLRQRTLQQWVTDKVTYLTVVAKLSILDVCGGPGCTFEWYKNPECIENVMNSYC